MARRKKKASGPKKHSFRNKLLRHIIIPPPDGQ